MRRSYVQQMADLHTQLSDLGIAVNNSVEKAVQAYVEHDVELAHELFSDDLRINAATVEIEKEAYRLIALQQPVAGDLRMIFTVLHASVDLERIGDHAVSIARATLRTDPEEVESETLKNIIKKMAEIVHSMIEDTIKAYLEEDVESAREIAARDEQVDMLQKDIYRDSEHRMEKSPERVAMGINYIGVSNNLERIGDYVKNICERIIFLNTGEIIDLG